MFPWWWVLISLLLALGVLLSLWRGRRTEALHAQQLAEFEDRSSRSVPGSLLNPACSGTEETAPRRSPMLTPSCRSARGDGDLTADKDPLEVGDHVASAVGEYLDVEGSSGRPVPPTSSVVPQDGDRFASTSPSSSAHEALARGLQQRGPNGHVCRPDARRRTLFGVRCWNSREGRCRRRYRYP